MSMKISDLEEFEEEFFESLEKTIPREDIVSMKEDTEEIY